jgi:hypothetical protein
VDAPAAGFNNIFFLSILLHRLDNAEHNSIVFGGLMMVTFPTEASRSYLP